MLQQLSEQAAEGYRLARDAKKKADRAADDATRGDYPAIRR